MSSVLSHLFRLLVARVGLLLVSGDKRDAEILANRDARRAFQRRHAKRSTRHDGLAEIRIVAPRDVIDTVWAAAERGDIGRLQLVLDTDFIADIATSAHPVDGEATLGSTRIAPEVAMRWSRDIRASVIVEDGGHVHDEGRNCRTLNRRQRHALHRRDHGTCRFPGCRATSWLPAHHIIH